MRTAGRRAFRVALEPPASAEAELQRFVNAGRLAAEMAHDLLSALGVAQTDVGFLCEALERCPAGPELREAACDAQEALGRAVAQMSSVMSVARSRRGEAAPLEVREAVAAALFELHGALEPFQLVTELAPVPFAIAERGALLQTLISLLLDAVESSPPRGRIVVGVRQEGAEVVVTVDDEGPAPLSAESLPERPATPIGISRRVVRSFGGEVTASAGPLGGRRATVRLQTRKD